MINQRQDSIILYKQGKREELAKQENNEIKIIETKVGRKKQIENNPELINIIENNFKEFMNLLKHPDS